RDSRDCVPICVPFLPSWCRFLQPGLIGLLLRYKGNFKPVAGLLHCNERFQMTPDQNDLLCRIEGEAPMGRLMRQHWMPACMIEEVAEPDGAPLKVRLLGENMVVF